MSDDIKSGPLQQMRNASDQLVSDFSPVQYTELSAIPDSGSANYQGYMSGQLADTTDAVTDTLIGRLSLQVAFDEADMVSGSVDDFLDDRGYRLEGQLVLSGGVLDRDGNPNVDATFSFDGVGELIDRSGQTISLDTAFAGDFLAATYSGLGGDVQGQASVNGTAQSFGGIFIASR